MTINYELAKQESRGLKARLTRAVNSGDPKKVIAAVEHAYARFDVWGAFPDDWRRWENAKNEAKQQLARVRHE